MKARPGAALGALCILLLTGCVAAPRDPGDPCGGNPDCAFFGAPPLKLSREVKVFAARSYPFRALLQAVEFRDESGRRWRAPHGILTDGASIPPVFTPIIGDPARPEYRLAAALHDAYCGWGNETAPTYHARPWRAVHRMFYKALRAGGTPELRAKTIYAATMLAGPRWQRLRADGDPPGPRNTPSDLRPEFSDTPPEALLTQMAEVAKEIRRRNPNLDEIDTLVGAARGSAARKLPLYDASDRGPFQAEDGTLVYP